MWVIFFIFVYNVYVATIIQMALKYVSISFCNIFILNCVTLSMIAHMSTSVSQCVCVFSKPDLGGFT